MIAVQIGTNRADDFFYSICREKKFDMIYLIEPLTRFNDVVHKYYDSFKHKICNIAIKPKHITEALLYELNDEGTHNSLIKRKSHPEWIDKEPPHQIVPSITFDEFCIENGITEIELLCIDTEGLDCEILLSIDFDKVNIKEIIWEVWSFENDDGDGIFRTGLNVLVDVCHKLNQLGYEVGYLDQENFYARRK